MAPGAELLILSGENDSDPTGQYPDDVFVGADESTSVVSAPHSQLSIMPLAPNPFLGTVTWIRKNPVIAGGIAIAAFYIIMKVMKKRRGR